ncbi:MAG TPA: hypothetical protein VMV69_01430 [Pirellulales bacterium]|nr:hypothetical protein [Pirellulales bacterium]
MSRKLDRAESTGSPAILAWLAFDAALVVSALAVVAFVLASTSPPPSALQMVAGSQDAAGGAIVARVDADNGLWIGDEPLPDMVTFSRRLARLRGERGGEVQIVVSADREALFRVLAQTLSGVRESGAATCRLTFDATTGEDH